MALPVVAMNVRIAAIRLQVGDVAEGDIQSSIREPNFQLACQGEDLLLREVKSF